jgi:hypothetical protein
MGILTMQLFRALFLIKPVISATLLLNILTLNKLKNSTKKMDWGFYYNEEMKNGGAATQRLCLSFS